MPFKKSVNPGAGSLKKINKIERPVARLIKRKIEKNQIDATKNDKGDITTEATEIQITIRDYYKQHYVHKPQIRKKWINFWTLTPFLDQTREKRNP